MTPSSPFSSSPSPSPWVANQSFNKSWAQQIEESYQLHSALALRVSSLAASAADSNFLDFNSDANTNRVSFSSSSSSSSPQHVSHRFWVVPTLQGMGIGTIIVKRIVRFFFKACGFRDDILGFTTMMYSRTVSTTCFEGERMVKQAGRKLLLVLSLQFPLAPSKTSKPQS
ncbi:hypothetical protein ES332_D09G140900v1 [Gossypium tomentosum]|uniref:Uncharacterized protein n=1 Tax=Gossypium tomentosum TaxID=34277 RepID=A0A5D2JHY9_GOSTO|nr:hypothetical protein ES332_D09G140900v1 [Gossypium tomentosum]